MPRLLEHLATAAFSEHLFMQKKELESTNARWNEFLNRGIGDD
jgi:hypothetical protein